MLYPFLNISLPEPRELTHVPLEDIQAILDEYYSGDRMFRESDLKELTHRINHLIEYYKTRFIDLRYKFPLKYELYCNIKFSFRILSYGSNFKFALILNIDNEIKQLYYGFD